MPEKVIVINMQTWESTLESWKEVRRQKNVLARREKRKDPQYRELERKRNSEAKRRKRMDPAYRARERMREAEARRRKRKDPEYRAREKACRERRNEMKRMAKLLEQNRYFESKFLKKASASQELDEKMGIASLGTHWMEGSKAEVGEEESESVGEVDEETYHMIKSIVGRMRTVCVPPNSLVA